MVSKNSPLTLIKKVTQRVLTPLITSPPPPPPPPEQQHTTNTVILSLPTRTLWWYISNTHAEQHRFFFLSLSLSLSLSRSFYFFLCVLCQRKDGPKKSKILLTQMFRVYSSSISKTPSHHLPTTKTLLDFLCLRLCAQLLSFENEEEDGWW